MRGGYQKATWKQINEMISKRKNEKSIVLEHNGSQYTSNIDVARIFNDFFCNIGKKLDDNIPHSNINPTVYMGPRSQNSFFASFCTSHEVSIILNLFKTKLSKPLD